MEKVIKPSFLLTCRNYFLLSKPGIIFGNAVAAIGGFAFASKAKLNMALFFYMLIGLSLIIASACIFNNYIDREIDAKMKRTRNRILVKKLISSRNAMIYAVVLLICGILLLFFKTNTPAAALAFLGFFIYVGFYSLLKHLTLHATLVGSLAGAIPPLVGYSSVTGSLDIGSIILFIIFALWQMPHFFAIALYRMDDYVSASIPILPIKKGVKSTKTHMLIYIIAFMMACFFLTFCKYARLPFFIGTGALSLLWIVLCLQGYRCKNDQIWARKMFIFSLVMVMALSLLISFNFI